MKEQGNYTCLCQFHTDQPIVFARHCRDCPLWREKKDKLKELLKSADLHELAVLNGVSERSLHRWAGPVGGSGARYRGLRKARWGGKTVRYFLTQAGRGKMGEVRELIPVWVQDKDLLNAMMAVILTLPSVPWYTNQFRVLFNLLRGKE